MRLTLAILAACSGEPKETDATDPPDTVPPGDTDATIDTDPDRSGPAPSPVAVQGQLLDVPVQADSWIAGVLAGTPWGAAGVRGTVWVSVGADGVNGLTPTLTTKDDAVWPLVAAAEVGRYDLPVEAGFAWIPFTEADVRPGAIDAWDGVASAYMAGDALVYVAPKLPLGADLELLWGGQGFHSAVAVVVDAAGTVTWTDDPADRDGLANANAIDTDRTLIPAAAFPAVGDYAVGLAPCVRTFPNDLVQLDPGSSAVRAGQMTFRRVQVE